MVVILEPIQEKKLSTRYNQKGHRPFHLSLYQVLCFLSDNGGCISYYKIYTGCKLNFQKLDNILDFCIQKGFINDIRNTPDNKKVLKSLSSKYPTVNIVNTRRIIFLKEYGLKFINDYSDYFEELEHIFAKIMPKTRQMF